MTQRCIHITFSSYSVSQQSNSSHKEYVCGWCVVCGWFGDSLHMESWRCVIRLLLPLSLLFIFFSQVPLIGQHIFCLLLCNYVLLLVCVRVVCERQEREESNIFFFCSLLQFLPSIVIPRSYMTSTQLILFHINGSLSSQSCWYVVEGF